MLVEEFFVITDVSRQNSEDGINISKKNETLQYPVVLAHRLCEFGNIGAAVLAQLHKDHEL